MTKKTKKTRNPGSSARPLTLLGNSKSGFPSAPAQATLETFPNRNSHRNFWIQFECADFTSLCPVTGQPDFAHLTIEYVPDKLCIETKSLKFYLSSYRNERSFNEDVANHILDDLIQACHPRQMKITAAFASRGGIALTVHAEYPDEEGN